MDRVTQQSPAMPPSQAAAEHPIDATVWRVGGDAGAPLVPATGTGSLDGHTLAVKDLYAVAGHRIGAGNPSWLADAPVQDTTATAITQLLEAGAAIAGIAQTDELALSLAGTNQHYGTPPNPAAPQRISGGSNSGSASAAALGQASIGLGSDTGGSIRVPASYQGLWGIRSTHDAIALDGVQPLAQSFDTIGWMTRDADTLAAVAQVLLRHPATSPGDPVLNSEPALKIIPTLFDQVQPEVTEAVRAALTAQSGSGADGSAERSPQSPGSPIEEIEGVTPEMHAAWFEAFRIIQFREAWANHGEWIAHHWETMASDVGARFRMASELTADQEMQARALAAGARRIIRRWVGDEILAVPSAAGPAPLRADAALGGTVIEEHRRSTMLLTCLAGLAGLPAVNVPLRTRDHLPTGVCLIGPAGSDIALIHRAAAFHARIPAHQSYGSGVTETEIHETD
ncbi:Asp-tRNA(Asn)/Glu-tRNA(Gln) amidotransferase A subunit family amidase [Nesterenkonia aurantiaca]|uniref:Asp-tRNA(Asn)/Glu-tRNA(Gln) amidotransferase A subunit family amidase n=2 Tax=Nesterenkonia aurantiaca TaxID=1436010 RepID=A0A4R7G7E6_9MICC|nr:Asp-tRNA(Asn)/Glu-tRNA(Gln) amidotransferase A subunit family amidase [Nesterenkonia aurantiaca]